jgi:hypothetical protein
MGYIWHDRRVDFGIDGEIELRDPVTEAALNLMLLVQSKATDRAFSSETSSGFDYRCDERDVAYWLQGNAPVLLVCCHPRTDEGWWVSIKDWFADPSRRRDRVVHFDKASMRFDSSAATALLDLAVPAERGLYLRPPPRTERLTSNLLVVAEVPSRIYGAGCLESVGKEAVRRLAEAGIWDRDFLLRGQRIFSFRDLHSPPFEILVDPGTDITDEPTAVWAQSTDDDRLRRYADLLARALRAMVHEELAWAAEERCLYFKATPNLRPRRIRNSSGRSRTVFTPYRRSPDDPDKISYCRHDAFKPRFTRVDGTWFLTIVPTDHYTQDGHRPSLYADELRSGLRRLQRNRAVLGQVKMWAYYLQGGGLWKKDQPIVFGGLADFEVDRGIDEARWKTDRAAEAQGEFEDLDDQGNDAFEVDATDAGFNAASLFDGEALL